MKKQLYIFILFLLIGCKWEIPELKTLKECAKPTVVSSVVDPTNSQKYNFSVTNDADIKYPITWQNNLGTTIGTSNTNSFSYTFTSDGNYTVRASFQTICGDNVSLATNSISVNTQLLVEKNFALTDPMVSKDQNEPYVQVTNDGTIIATDNGTINVWNYSNQTIIKSFKPSNNNYSKRIALSPDEKVLYVAYYQKVEAWDWKTGLLIKTIYSNSTFDPDGLSLSPDGGFLASSTYDFDINPRKAKILVWNLFNNTTKEFPNIDGRLWDLKISKNSNKIVFATTKNILKVLDYSTGNEVFNQEYLGYGFNISSSGELLISVKSNNNVEVRNLTSNLIIKNINHNKAIDNISIGPVVINISNDDNYAIIGDILYDMLQHNQIIWDKNNNFNGLAENSHISNNNKYIVTSTNLGDIALINLSDGSKVNTISSKHPTLITNSFVGPDNKYLYSIDVTGAKSWDINTGNIVKNLNNLSQGNRLSFGTNSFWIRNCGLSKYEYNNGTLNYNYPIGNCIGSMICSKNDKYVASTNFYNANITIYDGSNGAAIINYDAHPNSFVGSMIFSNDEKYFISLGFDKNLKIYDIANRQIIKTISFVNPPSNLTYTKKLNAISFYEGQKIKSLDFITGIETELLSANFNNFCLNNNENQIACNSGTSNQLSIYNLTTKQLLKQKSFPNYIVKTQYNSTGTQIYVTTTKEFYVINAP